MSYFGKLMELLQIEKEEDRAISEEWLRSVSVQDRRAAGITWYPIAIRDTEVGRGDYLTVEIERPGFQDIIHQFRFGSSVSLFSQHDASIDRLEGVVSYVSTDRMKISFRTEELPDWSRNGKLGVDLVFDKSSYEEMEQALRYASQLEEKEEKNVQGRMVRILTGKQKPAFQKHDTVAAPVGLNSGQEMAVEKILSATELAIVHGPPGTGKTTTLVQAIHAVRILDGSQVLVVAPSNAAVDLLSEKLSNAGMKVVRVGNPARVSERLTMLTMDYQMTSHASMKQIRQWKKQAREFRDMAQKYKRNFGRDEREQRKALFTEARNLGKQIEKEEKFIVDDILAKADVITATLVGSDHYTVRHLRYKTVVIDEAGQALEPACWIAILKGEKLVLAGDHQQLPPTIRSQQAARGGLETTLLEKLVQLHPEAVVLLEEQYRMHEQIMSYPSSVFYKNKLLANPMVAHRLLYADDVPVVFIDTAGCGFEEKAEGTGTSNPEEAAFMIRHLEDLLENMSPEENPYTIGVLSPYKHQVEILKELVGNASQLEKWRSLITVNTIDSFQGQERDVMYISMTRSNTEGEIGFLNDTRRMNVAMTRAKRKLVVVGDGGTLSQLPFYAGFISFAQEQGAYHSAWEFAGWM